MNFKRKLRENFIESLNRLHQDKNSWWRKIVDDKDAFILIRNNRLHVLVNGGLLLQINMDRNGKLICKTHEEFLSLRSEKNPYIILTEESTETPDRVEGLKGLSKHYEHLKRRIKIFTGKEKQTVQDIVLKYKQFVDVEVGLEGDKKENALKKGAQRIDMAALLPGGVLSFIEVKLFDNSEIRANEAPSVVEQLKKYQKLLKKYGDEILEGYNQQFEVYSKLNGRFFKNRFPGQKALKIYPEVRLFITGFDGSQRKHLLPIIRDRIYVGMNWPKNTKNLIATGNHKVVKDSILFKDISS
jgi:hypothetical protein